jgi:opacity protein-like surface antigen
MKKKLLILITIIFSYLNISAQEVNKSKFSIIGNGGIGYGIVENDSEPSYNLNSNSGELLINYNLSENFGIATGIGLNQLTGNGFNSVGEFYHERNFIKIPLLFTLNGEITEKIEFFSNVGFYTQNIVRDNYRYLSSTSENTFEGWNFGGQIGIGILFNFVNKMKFGFAFNGQSDLSKFKSNNSTGIIDKQKMKNLNTIGLILKFDL